MTTHLRADLEADLRTGFAGEVIVPDDPGYDEARTLFNAMIDRRPAVIAQCANTTDVARAIGFARGHGLEVAVRGGGHGVAGNALVDGGLVVDLRRMDGAMVDPEARAVRVGGGATMSRLDRATEPYGLVTTGGRVSTTGVGGFILGGGSSWLERKYGLACDNLLSVELVTADGTVVRASEEENPDLFWALHGGGGNFGVATSFTLRLYPLPALTVALLLWPAVAGPEILTDYRDFMESAPDEVGGLALFRTAPPEEFVPDALVDRPAFAIMMTYTGTGPAADAALAPMLRLGHAGGMVAEMPHADLQCMVDDPPGYRDYWSADHLHSLPDEAVARFSRGCTGMIVPSPSQQFLIPMGGAVANGRPDYPVPWRADPWVLLPWAMWADPADDERARTWVHEVRDVMRPWSTGSVYLNFIGNEGADRVRQGFGTENYERLAEVKRRFDPDNVFHLNPNIKPA